MEIISGVIPKPLKIVLYGSEGIGKSTFAAHAPDPLFIDTEGSTERMDVRRLPRPTSYQMLLQEIEYVKQNPHLCRTLVVDTADWAERLCRDGVLAKYNKTGIEDFGYGKGYIYVAEDFGRMLNKLNEVLEQGIHVIVTAHAQMRKFEQPDEMGAYDRWELKLAKQTAPLLKEWADMVLFANYETYVVTSENKKAKAQGGKRVMHTTHHPCWDAKNRFGLPDKLPFEFAQIAGLFLEVGAPNAAEVRDGSESTLQEKSEVEFCDSSEPMDNSIPTALHDLMQQNCVTEDEIVQAVAQRGYYPGNMRIADYDPAFISGVLVGAWPGVFEMIRENRNQKGDSK